MQILFKWKNTSIVLECIAENAMFLFDLITKQLFTCNYEQVGYNYVVNLNIYCYYDIGHK